MNLFGKRGGWRELTQINCLRPLFREIKLHGLLLLAEKRSIAEPYPNPLLETCRTLEVRPIECGCRLSDEGEGYHRLPSMAGPQGNSDDHS